MATKKGSHRPPAKKSSKKAVPYVALTPSKKAPAKKKSPASKKAAKKKAPVAYVALSK